MPKDINTENFSFYCPSFVILAISFLANLASIVRAAASLENDSSKT